ncbi:MAG TPA: hybrid sensor histidine kinase/response regulator [Candidatus Angelobacter sp.]
MIPNDRNLRVLVLARFGRDSELLESFLRRHGFLCHAISNADEFLVEVDRGAATAIITEESLTGTDALAGLVQAPWSDFPLIVLTATGSITTFSTARLAALRNLGNVTLVERPIRMEILLSAVESAIRARLRQYDVRDFMLRQADSEEALRRTEKLAVAGRLAASIAHEINNPLTAVTNLLFLVKSAQELKEARHYASLAEDELRRVSEIANHTLRFHRSAKGPERVDVRQLLESAVVLFRAKLRNQNIKVKVECDEGSRVVCTLGEIRQVLVNLIANAIDAMPKGGNLLLRGSDRCHPVTAVQGVRISVADHGEGISANVCPKLFEPFFTTKGNIGTGLGLWLTKDIIERHSGFIRVRNHRCPHGAVFSFWIPKKPRNSGSIEKGSSGLS